MTATKELCPVCARVAYGRLCKMLGKKANDPEVRGQLVQALTGHGGHLESGCIK